MDAWLEALPRGRVFLLVVGAILIGAAGGVHAVRGVGFVQRFGNRVEGALRVLVAVILLGMVFLSGLQIVLRNFFDSGLLWIDPLLRHLVLALALIGAVIATGLKRHVQINVLGRLLQGKTHDVVGGLIAILAGGVTLTLAHAALLFLADERAFGETLFLGIPSWGVALLFPVAFLAMTYRFFRLAFLEFSGEAPLAGEDAAATGDRGLSDDYPTLKPEETGESA